MLSKRKALGHGEGEVSPSKRLRHNIADLFLSGTVSGRRAQSLYADAVASQSKGCREGARVGTSGRRPGNAARDLLSMLLRKSRWPRLYYADIRMCNTKLQVEEVEAHPFLLPHEVVACIVRRSGAGKVLDSQRGWDSPVAEHINKACADLRIPVESTIALGIWIDGVPCNWDRSESLEVISMSIGGFKSPWKNLRIPITVVEKRYLVAGKTYDDMLKVVVHSCDCLARGKHMERRFDGRPWTKADRVRARFASKGLGVRGLLADVRGDWMMYKTVFRFPQWNEQKGCCIKCRVRPGEIRNVDANAAWRTDRLDTWGLIRRMQENHIQVPSIFGAPGFESSCFKEDWLHNADLGVTSDFLGNLCWYLLQKMPGEAAKQRCKQLFLLLQAWYRTHKVTNRLDQLTPTMLRMGTKSPKLRAYAAEARAMVPWGQEMAHRFLSREDAFEEAIICAADSLARCYDCLSDTTMFPKAVLAEHSRRFCQQVVALERSSPVGFWKIKPKLHMWQELCEFSGHHPTWAWTYRDEDFGGSMAALARSRGGRRSAVARARVVLLRFISRHPVPDIS